MSKVTLSPLITDVRKRMGNIVFSKWKDTNYVRQYSSHSRGESEKQLETRTAFSTVVSVWKNMGPAHHASWDMYAQNMNMSGYNAFLKSNLSRVLENSEMELFKSTGEDEPASLYADADPGTGEIICVFSLPVIQPEKHVIFFAQMIEDGRISDIISMHDAGADPSSPFTISGLLPGVEYFIYAIAADADYASAETVSAAVCVRAAAGM